MGSKRDKRKRRQRDEEKKDTRPARVNVLTAASPYRGRVPLEYVDGIRWRIPKTGPMNVDGIVYADETLLPSLREDQSLEQVANVATLPGIVGHSMAMPDIHWGYGFPIGGVAAFDPKAGGIVSPGGVGYDINCLSGDSQVLHADGYTRSIRELVEAGASPDVVMLANNQRSTARVAAAFGRKNREAWRVCTVTGRELVATGEHPVLTPDGMRATSTLKPGDRVAVLAFRGVPYTAPASRTIVDEARLRDCARELGKTDAGHGITQAVQGVRELLPLKLDHRALPVLLKVAGYVLGDGTVYFERARMKGRVVVYGEPEDLRRMARDLAPWCRASRVYSRMREHRIRTQYGEREFRRTEHCLKIRSTGLALLLAAMGIPVGVKSARDFRVPDWIHAAPLWQQRLFLAGYFGAELSTPAPIEEHGHCFQAPVVCLSKRPGFVESGVEFLRDIAALVERFGVRTLPITTRAEQTSEDGTISTRVRLAMSSEAEHLTALWAAIGFEYNEKRARRAAQACAYLAAKGKALAVRDRAREEILELRAAHGWGARAIAATMRSAPNLRFVERTICGHPNRRVRVGDGFPTFEAWLPTVQQGIEGSDVVWEEIEELARTEASMVYDLTVDHEEHNFVANGFVVHNCGVRLLASDVGLDRVKPALEPLVDELFAAIPAGIGGKRRELQVTTADLAELMTDGLLWARRAGLATEEDVAHAEENGRIDGADPSRVSARARERGVPQLGTLGSGNHFAEVGVIDEVYDVERAAAFGLRQGQITLMIHSGSRGLGHQVCTDSLTEMLRASAEYEIPLVDRQLCCAPIHSEPAGRYLAAMAAAANFAFVNRQVMAHFARDVFGKMFDATLSTVYDVCHNIAKFEEHEVDGKKKRLLLHRKGATRALPKGHALLPPAYRDVGQPVIIPGDMGRYSFVLAGAERSRETFGSACHGAGRVLSRGEAKRRFGSQNIIRDLAEQGIFVRGASRATVVEEAPLAYKDVADVVDVVQAGGLADKVARIRPLGVVKG
jgi:tRNA-splicing ligase RtcB